MAGPEPVEKVTTPKHRRFPWLLLLLLIGSVYLFWVMPYQRGDRPVQVEFESK